MGVGRKAKGGRTALVAIAVLVAAAIARGVRSRPQAPENPPAPPTPDRVPFFPPVEVTAPPVPAAAPAVTTVEAAAPPPRERTNAKALALAAVALLGAGTALALGLARDDDATVARTAPTAEVLGTQTSVTAPAATRTTAARVVLPRATGRTPLRSRGFALLVTPASELPRFVGARVTGRVTRVDAVVGDDIFWVGKGSRRLLVHLQGPGTRFAVRRGQRLSFAGVVARTRPGAAARWGLSWAEGRRQLERQGHNLEVYGPNIRFVCASRCFRFR